MAVLATSMSMTEKMEEELERISYIWYFVTLKDWTEALLNLKSEVNAMSQAFTSQLELKIQKTNIKAQKIDGTILNTYAFIVSIFFMSNKDDRERFFEKSF